MDKKLENLRKQIDKTDEHLLKILAKRVKIVKKIGKYKKERQMKPLDKIRWQQVLEKNSAKSENLNLSKKFIKEVFSIIHKYSLEIQQ